MTYFNLCMPLCYACFNSCFSSLPSVLKHILQRFNGICKALFKHELMKISYSECEGTCTCSAWVHCVDKDKMGSRVDSETLSSAQLVLTCT